MEPVADPVPQAGSAVPTGSGQTADAPSASEAGNEITVVGQKIVRGTPSATKGKVNKIIGARLDADEFVAEVGQGWFAPLEPGPGGLSAPGAHGQAGRKAAAVVAIANVDLVPDAEALAFIRKTAPALSNALVKGGNRAVEKHIMVEWDSSRGRYVVTGAKVLVAAGGAVGDLKPVLPETLAAIRAKRPPRAFVVHTHRDGSYNGETYSSLPGPGDGWIPKEWLLSNFTVEADSRNPKIYQTTLIAGRVKPGSRKPVRPKVAVVQHLPDGRVRRVGRYDGMPK